MKEVEVRARAFAMPLTSPAFPPGPYRFIDREYLIITYRTDPAKLRQLIEDCRRTGYSAVEDELAYGVVALAVPVLDQSGRVVAALNSSSHSRRISKTKLIRERFSMLQQVSRQISADLASVPGLSLSAGA